MVFEWQRGRDFQANLGVEDDGAVGAKSAGALPQLLPWDRSDSGSTVSRIVLGSVG